MNLVISTKRTFCIRVGNSLRFTVNKYVLALKWFSDSENVRIPFRFRVRKRMFRVVYHISVIWVDFENVRFLAYGTFFLQVVFFRDNLPGREARYQLRTALHTLVVFEQLQVSKILKTIFLL